MPVLAFHPDNIFAECYISGVEDIAIHPATINDVSDTFKVHVFHSLDGLNGRLNPPVRFMYCLYFVDFSLRTADTLLPGIFLFCVVLKVEKPIIFRSNASSLSSPSSAAA
jgi:hypothetical protein